MRRMHGCQQQLKDFRAQLDAVAKRKAEIIALLDKAVNDSHPQRDALLTIFHRKLKRSRKKVNEDEDDDSDDEDGGDDDFDDDDAQEMCPPGCDQALYDEVCCSPTRLLTASCRISVRRTSPITSSCSSSLSGH